jgi:hypothetical protein
MREDLITTVMAPGHRQRRDLQPADRLTYNSAAILARRRAWSTSSTSSCSANDLVRTNPQIVVLSFGTEAPNESLGSPITPLATSA